MLVQKIKNKLSGQITNEARFLTQAEVDAWLTECIAVEAFGKNAKDAVLNEMGEVVQEAVEAEYEVLPVEDITAELAIQAAKQSKIDSGKAARQVCQDVLDYIAGANLDKALTIQQITQMQSTYANAEAALRAGRPTLAKQLISAISPDGVIVTEDEKQDCLSLLTNY